MNVPSRLWLLTEAFPFGPAEEFLETELACLAGEFERVIVVPVYHAGRRGAARPLPANAQVELPPRNPERNGRRIPALAGAASDPQARRWFAEERPAARAFGPRGLLRLALRLAAARRIRDWLRPRVDTAEDVLCAYWLAAGATALAMLSESTPALRAASRAHGVDVYPGRSDPPYLPLQGRTIAGLSRVFAISSHGADDLRRRFPEVADRITSDHPLGVRPATHAARPSTDGVLRVVTCSRIVPVKRLGLLVEALARCRGPIEWTHVGGDLDGGASRAALERAAGAIPPPIACRFMGHLAQRHVYAWYASRPVDLLVNVSESEGRPVSILEALAHGIPVLATAVGGVPEIVGDDCGWLAPASIGAAELAERLDAIAADPSVLAPRREAALARWRRQADAGSLFAGFASALKALKPR